MKSRFLLALLPALALFTSSVSAQDLTSLTTMLSKPSGEQTSVAQLGAGKVTVVSFWATWCVPCKKEMSAMQPIYEELGGQFEYIAVSTDQTKTMAKVGPYIQAKKYTFPVLLDPNSELFLLVNGTSVPYTLIYRADGTLFAKHDGYLEGDEVKLKEELQKLIVESKGGAK